MSKQGIAGPGRIFMMRKFYLLQPVAASLITLLIAISSAAQPGMPFPDPARDLPLRISTAVPLDSISWDTFRADHAFSLDHFLENMSGFILGRQGGIGAPTRFSRFGMGLGRCVVLLEEIPMNDPQNDIAPLVLIPTTDVGAAAFGRRSAASGSEGIEGVLSIDPPPVPLSKPEAILELSKGTNDIKQRRVRFSSVRSALGIDLAYDELLNDGYQFDARASVTAPDLGRFSSRVYSMRARGTLSGTDEYSLSFKRYTSAYLGDLLDPERELRRRGHLATAATRLGTLRLRAFEREFESTLPDSCSENQTVGAMAFFDILTGGSTSLSMMAGFEDLVSRQEIRGAVAHSDLQKIQIGISAGRALRGFQAGLDFGIKHQFSFANGWGGGVSLSRQLNARHQARATLERRYRLPNLGELFAPRHPSAQYDTVFVAGNSELGSEHAYEVRVALASDLGKARNEISMSLIRIGDPVVPRALNETGTVLRTFENGGEETATVVMDRFSIVGTVLGTHINLGGGAVYSEGDRNYFLRSIPQTKVDASLSLGRVLFRPSTDMVFTAQFQHCTRRRVSIDGSEMPSYQVLNLKLDARLLDAHLYLMWLNVTDAKYQTDGPYLMTPRTLVYGVEWTIFN